MVYNDTVANHVMYQKKDTKDDVVERIVIDSKEEKIIESKDITDNKKDVKVKKKSIVDKVKDVVKRKRRK